MENTKKVYRSKFYNTLTITLRIEGKRVVCEFTGSSTFPVNIKGSYATRDKTIQEALENHSLFKKDYYLESTFTDTPIAQVTEEGESDIGAEDDSPRTIEVKDISSVTKAKEFLNRRFKVPYAEMKNREQVIAKAEELNIVFTDLDV